MKRLCSFFVGLVFLGLFLAVPKALAAENKISDFENNTLGGWNNGNLTGGYNSNYSLKLENRTNDSIGSTKIINAPILRSFTNLEMDIHLHGSTLLSGDAAGIVFDQAGWKLISLKNYIINGKDDWQHVNIPLADFSGLNTNNGIASMTMRFWNTQAGVYDIDNIKVTNNGTPPPTVLPAPTNLAGSAQSSTQINLNWQGSGPSYNIYRNDIKIATTNSFNYSDTSLSANTTYKYYVKTTDGSRESNSSNIINIQTNNIVPPPTGSTIGNFDDNTTNGFDRGQVTNGTLQLQNPTNGDASSRKVINAPILKGQQSIEFDLNLNGSYLLDGDAAIIAFDQAGMKMVALKNKVTNGLSGWQHIKIGLSEFSGLNTNDGIASISFRFWNYRSNNYNIDNIVLTGNITPPPTDLTAPSNLIGNYGNNTISLSWTGNGPTYIIYRNGNEIARTQNNYFEDTNIQSGQTYQYYIKTTDGTRISNSSNTTSVNVPTIPVTPPTKWQAEAIDAQVMSKYWAIADANQIRHLVQADKSIGAKQITIDINYDNYSLMKLWADIIHSEGLNVWFRPHWDAWDSWEKPEIKNGITSTEYLNRSRQFILSHPDLFRAGDAFTICVESENAAWWTGIDHGPFNGWDDWRAFTRNQVLVANDAFNQIGLGGKIKTNWINMNGWVAWNVLDQQTVNVIGQLTLDHIIDWTNDTGTYVNAILSGTTLGDGSIFYGYDQYYAKWNVPIMAGEWGYSTFDQSMDPDHQKELAAAVMQGFSTRNYFIGMNYWVDVGHASRLFDTPNLLDYTPRPIASVIKQYYV